MRYQYAYWLTNPDPYLDLPEETAGALRILDKALGLDQKPLIRHQIEWRRHEKLNMGQIVADAWEAAINKNIHREDILFYDLFNEKP